MYNNGSNVPRALLKTGKRKTDYLDASRLAELAHSPDIPSVPSPTSIPEDLPQVGLPPKNLSDSVRFSAIMKDINLLREDVNDLKKDIRVLHRQSQTSTVPSTCHVKLSLFDSAILPPTNAEVSNILGWVVINITR